MAIASLQLELARRHGHLAGVIQRARFLASPVTGLSDEDIALGSDLRAATPKVDAFGTTQQRCREAIALAERYGWGTEPVIAPALMTLAGTMVWLGEFDEGERWLRRTERALRTATGPDIRLLLHQTAGILHAARGRRREALEEFGVAEDLASQLEGSQALASQMTGWLLATQARLGLPGEARARLAALDDGRASSGEIRNARAVISLAERDPAAALAAVTDVLDGTAPVLGYVTVLRRTCSPTSSTSCTAHPRRPERSPRCRRPRSSARASSGRCAICRPTCPGPRSPANCRSR